MKPNPLQSFLIVCFWASKALIFLHLFISFRTFFLFPLGIVYEPPLLLQGIGILLSSLWLFLFFYSVYFFYKYDRYSKSGIYFLFFNLFYSLIYFYKVIWKQRRPLVGSYQHEPVLGNTILLETEED